MKNSELYQKTVDILVQAYFNDTLVHQSCSACAVGNIVAANKGKTPSEYSKEVMKRGNFQNGAVKTWTAVFATSEGKQKIHQRYLKFDFIKKEIASTGYTWKELARIEFAFESASKGLSEDEHIFNGLMAVIDVLDKIHENADQEGSTATKERFKKVCV